MRRTGLGTLFFGWLYGVPFLLIVGLIRRTSPPAFATHTDADGYAAVTDRFLTVALALNVAIPIGGLILARTLDEKFWLRHFAGSLAGMALIFVLVGVVAGRATAPLIGTVPSDQGPEPRVTRCIPVSGGHGCPGG
jgi:hypothetical protein